MLSKEDKARKVAQFTSQVEAAGAVIIAENAGLTAQEMEALRNRMRAEGCRAQVVKNTLAKRVLGGGHFAALGEHLNGPLVYGVGEDAVKVAKIFTDAARANPKFIVRGGALPQKDALDAAAVSALAKLPGREQLLAKLMGTMQAPVGKLLGTLNALPTGLVRALAAVRDQQSTGEGNG